MQFAPFCLWTRGCVMDVTIYHNPRCSKSRATLELIEAQGITPRIVEYLKTPPAEKELARIIGLLKITPRALLRTGEEEYKEHHLDNAALTDAQIIALMVKYPKLIERPVVVAGNKACIGRPPENVLKII